VGWFAAMPLGGLAALDPVVGRNPFLGWAALGDVYGAITGAALVWLLRQPQPAASAED
jgi:hypothetical protein